MKRIIAALKRYKELLVGIASLAAFIGVMTVFVFLFMSEDEPYDDKADSGEGGIAVTYSPTVTPTFTPVPTDTPTPTFTPTSTSNPLEGSTGSPSGQGIAMPTPTSTPTPTYTPTPTFTPTPTPTPTPLTPEQLRLMDQVEAKAAKYETLRAETEAERTLPAINITTLDGEKFKRKEKVNGKTVDNWITGYVEVFNCDEKYALSAFAEVKVRGNASAVDPPFPLRIKFDEKQGMLGLNKGNDFKNWVLLKPWSKVVTDYMAFKIGREIYDGDYYISDVTPVNVYVNGDYYGLYMLTEQNQVKKKRVNVNEPEDGYGDTDVGYLMEIDNYAGNDMDADPSFKMSYKVDGKSVNVKDFLGTEGTFVTYTSYTVHSDIYSQEQLDFIAEYTRNVFEIVYYATQENRYFTFDENMKLVDAGDRFKSAEETIAAVMDIESVVDTYLIEEIMGNYDRGNGSFYMCVDFSKKAKYDRLTFIAPWDFNWCAFVKSFIAGSFYGITSEGRYKECVHPWFILLMDEEWFRQKVAKRWDEVISTSRIDNVLSATREMVESNKDDFNLYGQKVTKRNEYGLALQAVSDLGKRISWLNTQIMKWLE